MGHMFLARYNTVTWMNAEEGEGRGGGGEGRDFASHRWFSSSRFSRLRRYMIHRDIWSWSRSSKFLSFFGI